MVVRPCGEEIRCPILLVWDGGVAEIKWLHYTLPWLHFINNRGVVEKGNSSSEEKCCSDPHMSKLKYS